MSTIHLVVPELFLPQPVAAEAGAGLALPELETVLARARSNALSADTLEAWLCEAFGAAQMSIASVTLRADGLQAGGHYWLRADPVHLSMQRDQLLLFADVRTDAAETAQLCASLNEHFATEGLYFLAPHPQRWYVQLREAADISTTPLLQVEGANVYEHMPQGRDALRWHGLCNEIQMLLSAHEVNRAREARGELPINSLWLWGGGPAVELVRPGARMYADSELALMFAQAAGMSCDSLPAEAERLKTEGGAILVWDGLRRAWRRGDLHAWREEVQRLERQCIRPLLDALRAGRIACLTLDALQAGRGRRFVLTRGAAWKLWRRPVPLAHYATI